MSKMKNACLAGCISISGIAQAELPINTKNLYLGVDPLILEIREDNLVTGYSGHDVITTNPEYNWGFRLFGGMDLSDDNYTSLTWERVHATNSNNSVGTLSGFGLEGMYKVDYSPQYDEVYLLLGHRFLPTQGKWKSKVGVGAEYARIVSEVVASGSSRHSHVYREREIISTMRGIGARIEGEIAYQIDSKINLFANLNAAFIVADRSFTARTVNYASNIIGTTNPIIPKAGLLLGLDYHTILDDQQRNKLKDTIQSVDLRVGWQAETYFNAVNRYSTFAGGNMNAAEGGAPSLLSNFSLQGFFLGVTVHA